MFLAEREAEIASDLAPRALVADDQPDIIEALRLLLKGEGYRVDSAASPAAVLEKLRTQTCDLLLMDLNYARDTTSGQEGLDLLTHVREIDGALPIVVMTAWGSIELAVEAMRRGVGDFVIKPWENARLLDTASAQVAIGRRRRIVERMEIERKAIRARIDAATGINGVCKVVSESVRGVMGPGTAIVLARMSTQQAFTTFSGPESVQKSSAGARIELDGDLSGLGDVAPIAEADLTEIEKAAMLSLGIRYLAPARSDGRLLGLLGIRSEANLESEERSFIAELASSMAAGLNNLQTRNQEHDYKEALEIQRSLLPEFLPQAAGFELSAEWRPARIVGGDYYDAIKISDTGIALCIADVSGKGMAAALLMSNLQAIIRSSGLRGVSPREVCNRVNRLISSSVTLGRFITFFYCVLDSASRRLIYSNAGHSRPILLRPDGSVERLDRGGAVLGAFPEWDFEEGSIRIAPGDHLVMFTDGVTEAVNGSDEEFGEDRLVKVLVANRTLSAAAMRNAILESVTRFAGPDLQDDATLLIVSVE